MPDIELDPNEIKSNHVSLLYLASILYSASTEPRVRLTKHQVCSIAMYAANVVVGSPHEPDNLLVPVITEQYMYDHIAQIHENTDDWFMENLGHAEYIYACDREYRKNIQMFLDTNRLGIENVFHVVLTVTFAAMQFQWLEDNEDFVKQYILGHPGAMYSIDEMVQPFAKAFAEPIAAVQSSILKNDYGTGLKIEDLDDATKSMQRDFARIMNAAAANIKEEKTE